MDYQILANEYTGIQHEIEWKRKCHSSYWYSINGHEFRNFCQAPSSASQFEYYPYAGCVSFLCLVGCLVLNPTCDSCVT